MKTFLSVMTVTGWALAIFFGLSLHAMRPALIQATSDRDLAFELMNRQHVSEVQAMNQEDHAAKSDIQNIRNQMQALQHGPVIPEIRRSARRPN